MASDTVNSHQTRQKPGSLPTVDPSFDLMFKILIVGDAGVGKTATFFRFYENTFITSYVSTVGIDFKVKTIDRQDKRIKLQTWDTAGQERFRSITHAYYRGAMGFILMFDVSNEESFINVREWATQIKELSGENVSVVVVGNKSDLVDSRTVSPERASQLAEQLGYLYIETSAKNGTNVNKAFEELADLICQRMSNITDDTLPPGTEPTNVRMHQKEADKEQWCSC